MLIAAHQPNFMPNLGFLYKMAQVDKFVVMTNLQFEKKEGWQRRHKIKGPLGDQWLTVPVLGSNFQKIKDVRINNLVNWRKKHKKTIEFLYSKSADRQVLNLFLQVYEQDWKRLVDLNYHLIELFRQVLEIPTSVILDEEVGGDKHELLINICLKHKASTYLSGLGAHDYMTQDYYREMEKQGIKHHFVQANVTGQYPYSSLHYILTKGPAWVRQAINLPV